MSYGPIQSFPPELPRPVSQQESPFRRIQKPCQQIVPGEIGVFRGIQTHVLSSTQIERFSLNRLRKCKAYTKGMVKDQHFLSRG